MQADYSIEAPRQRYLDLIHRYLQGRVGCYPFRTTVWQHWSEEREALWRHIHRVTEAQQCEEREQLERGERPIAPADDPRRLARMLDRLCNLRIAARKEEPFRASVIELLTAYREHGTTTPEARHVDFPPFIPVFQRPLPGRAGDRYPCTVEDIRRTLARVPEYDLEGLWAIGMASLERRDDNYYGTYYRWFRPMRKPVILLHSARGTQQFPLRYRSDPGYIERWFKVEREFGMEIRKVGGQTICAWPDECYRQYIVEHVLLHEIGHHVEYQQRWRAGFRRWLPSRLNEQFAEDYAIRFLRERRERQV